MNSLPLHAVTLDLAQLRQGCAQCSLQELCLPAGIGPGDLQRLDGIVKRKRPLSRGHHLFRTGHPLTSVFVAREGAFKTVTLAESGDEHILGFHVPGELIGLDALGAGVHRCDAVALNDALVCEVPFDDLAHVAAQLPALQQQLLRVIGQSVGRDQDRMGLLVRRQADERIALFLHGFGERLRHIGRNDRDFTLPMTREDIARYLGLALETVSRGFTRLQDDGLIAVRGRHVQVVDARALERLAHGQQVPSIAVRPSR